MNTFDQKPNFNYYQNHQFHKLVNKLPENKTLSLLHTNMCSLQGDFENFQSLISIGHKFTVMRHGLQIMIKVAISSKPWKAIKIIMALKKVNKSGCGF